MAIGLADLLERAYNLSWNVTDSDEVRYMIEQAVEKMELVAGRIALTTGRLRRSEAVNG